MTNQRPQDETLDGAGWTYKNVEHGGSEPDTMPQAIIATDAAGVSHVYVATGTASTNAVEAVPVAWMKKEGVNGRPQFSQLGLSAIPGEWMPLYATPPAPAFSEEEILGAVARGWCDPANSYKEMDSILATSITREVCATLRARGG